MALTIPYCVVGRASDTVRTGVCALHCQVNHDPTHGCGLFCMPLEEDKQWEVLATS